MWGAPYNCRARRQVTTSLPLSTYSTNEGVLMPKGAVRRIFLALVDDLTRPAPMIALAIIFIGVAIYERI